jgi:hypothetical protein
LKVVIQKTNDIPVSIGIGRSAVAGQGLQLNDTGDVLIVKNAEAALEITVIGDGGTGVYQEGDINLDTAAAYRK